MRRVFIALLLTAGCSQLPHTLAVRYGDGSSETIAEFKDREGCLMYQQIYESECELEAGKIKCARQPAASHKTFCY